MLLRVLFFALLLAPPAVATTLRVTTGADSGPGSLRQAILDANRTTTCPEGDGSVVIALPPGTAQGALRISLETPLPPLTSACPVQMRVDVPTERRGPAVVIRGPGDGLVVRDATDVLIRDVALEGFPGQGVLIVGSSRVILERVSAERSGGNGLVIADSEQVDVRFSFFRQNGANGIFARDVLDLRLSGGASANAGNGVHLHDARDSIVNSTVHDNAHTGILVTGDPTGTRLLSAGLAGNGLLGIDVGGDGVSHDRVPVIQSVVFQEGITRIEGTFRTTPGTFVGGVVYANDRPDPSGYGEGVDEIEYWFATADENGVAHFSAVSESIAADALITAVAYTPDGPSELSANVKVTDRTPQLVVTSTADSGPGSLRAIIEEANATPLCTLPFRCRIWFDIAGGGAHTIAPLAPLPVLSAEELIVDGKGIELNGAFCDQCNGLEAAGADNLLIRGLTINRFEADGIKIRSATGQPAHGPRTTIAQVVIGTDRSGSEARPNGRGIVVENVPVTISGAIVSGNRGDGIVISGIFAIVGGNRIGTDGSGLKPLGNGGSGAVGGAHFNSNLIAFNGSSGIRGSGIFSHNRVHSNGDLGIDIGEDGVTATSPSLIDVAEIVSAHAEGNQTRIRFRAPDPPVTVRDSPWVELYVASFADASGYGEARDFLDWRALASNDEQEIVLPVNLAGKYISAVVTHHYFGLSPELLSSSEFSRAVQVTTDGCPALPPQILGAVIEGSTATIRWSSLPGATEYRIWVMPPRDQPQIAYRGALNEATITMAPGTEWWIEARFDPCYGTQSEHRFMPAE